MLPGQQQVTYRVCRVDAAQQCAGVRLREEHRMLYERYVCLMRMSNGILVCDDRARPYQAITVCTENQRNTFIAFRVVR